MAGWLVGWLAGWLVGWLYGWLVGWLAGRLVGWLVGWLVGCFCSVLEVQGPPTDLPAIVRWVQRAIATLQCTALHCYTPVHLAKPKT